jgi:hypothetical protein
LGFERGACRLRGRLTRRLTLRSPPLTLHSTALRVGAGKSGVEGDVWKASSMMQDVVQFPCQAMLQAALADSLAAVFIDCHPILCSSPQFPIRSHGCKATLGFSCLPIILELGEMLATQRLSDRLHFRLSEPGQHVDMHGEGGMIDVVYLGPSPKPVA